MTTAERSNAENPRILIVGASAAGLKAGARAARLMPGAAITVLDSRTFISFGACGLPYFVAGDVDSLESLRETAYGTPRDPAFFAAVKGLDVRTGWTVTRLDPVGHTITAADAEGREETFSYDKLVIGTGATARTLPGVELGERVTCLHGPEDALAVRRGLETGQVGSAVVVGGGFIGVEMAVALADMWGCEVTIVEAEDRLLPNMLDPEMSDIVVAALRARDIEVHTGCPVTAARTVEEDGAPTGASVEAGGALEGKPLSIDHVVVALGVAPAVDLAVAAGLETGPRGALRVDERLRTSVTDIHAAGDCIEVISVVSGDSMHVPLGSLANRQGRVVGDNLAGLDSTFGPVAGSACVKVFDTGVAATGLTEAAARRAGLDARAAWGAFLDVAHYYPEPKTIFLKLVYEAGTGRILGLQGVGEGDVVKRVDVAAAILQRGGTLDDLLDLEFCYSPPFNAALDPLHGLAATALNQERFGIPGTDPTGDTAGRVVLDVRKPDEIIDAKPLIPDALNIAVEEVRARVAEIPRDQPLLVICERGPRSAETARWLQAQGFGDVVFVAGGAMMRYAAHPAGD